MPNTKDKDRNPWRTPYVFAFFLDSLRGLVLLGLCAAVAWSCLFLDAQRRTLPSDAEILSWRSPLATTLRDKNGDVAARLFEENRMSVPLSEVSPWVVKAVLASEDSNFFEHKGVSPQAVARALLENLSAKATRQGGSTITQQLAKNMFLTPEKTYGRKLREALLAVKMESVMSKERILETYLNTIYFGAGAWGIRAASETYFSKLPSELGLAEAALLAGLIPSPNRLNPISDPEASRGARARVLRRMEAVGAITREEAIEANELPVETTVTPNTTETHISHPWFVYRAVFGELIPMFGADRVYRGGLDVSTTLDPVAQRLAETAVASLPSSEGAMTVLSSDTGAVLAVVGGKTHPEAAGGFDRAVQSFRQPGSAFKPVVYAAAFEQGISPKDLIFDGPVRFGKWSPKNYDGKFSGKTTLENALIRSLNIPAVVLGAYLGADVVVKKARSLGIISPHLPENLTVSLGTASVSPMEMATVFSAFANGGYRVEPFLVSSVRDSSGAVLFERVPGKTRALSPEAAEAVRLVLSEAVNRGTGTAAKIKGVEVFGKTGTTNRYADAWFVGGVPGVVAAVYAGNDDNSPLKGKSTGGRVAAPVWKKFMKEYVAAADIPKKFPADAEGDAKTLDELMNPEVARMLDVASMRFEEYIPEDEETDETDENGMAYDPILPETGRTVPLAPPGIPTRAAVVGDAVSAPPPVDAENKTPRNGGEKVFVPAAVPKPAPERPANDDVDERFGMLLKKYGLAGE